MKKFWQFTRTAKETELEQFGLLPTDKYKAKDFPHSESPVVSFVVKHDKGHRRITGHVWNVSNDGLNIADVLNIGGIETAIFIRRTSTSTVELIKTPTANLPKPALAYTRFYNGFTYSREPRLE